MILPETPQRARDLYGCRVNNTAGGRRDLYECRVNITLCRGVGTFMDAESIIHFVGG